MTLTLNILDKRAELRSAYEATQFEDGKIRDFDWITGDEFHDPRLVKIRGSWYDTGDMMATREDWRDAGWDAEHPDTFYSAIVVKFLDGDDEGFVRVGEYLA